MPNLRYELAKLRTDYYLSGISERYAAHKELPPPRYVIWDCTRRCNLHCVHCGASKETYPDELATEQIERIIVELAALKVGMFAVTGGEPLLRRDLLAVLSYAQQRGLKTGFATNGFLLDRALSRQIKDTQVYSVQISVDGLEPTHNRIRGNSQSFTRALQAIELLLEHQVPLVSVATTVTAQNIAELEDIRRLLVRMGVGMWRLAVVMPIGRAQEAGIALDSGQLARLFGFIKANDRKGMRIYLGENLPFLGAWERRIRSAPLICPIGFTACCIGVDGHVRGCPEQPDNPETREGSLLERSFADIWRQGFSRYRRREILATDQECARCDSKHDCFGGCWVMRGEAQHCIRKLFG